MKNSLLILALILVIPFLSSLEISLNPAYSQGETMIVKISGNFQAPILDENVLFYRGHVRTSIPFSLAKIQGDYYISASLLDKTPGNYSFVISGAEYLEGSTLRDQDIVANFSISNSTADFLVKEGFAIANESFSLFIQNLKNTSVTVDLILSSSTTTSSGAGFLSFLFGGTSTQQISEKESFTLKSGEIKEIPFKISNVTEDTLKKITLESAKTKYELPVFLIASNYSEESGRRGYRFNPTFIAITLSTDKNSTGTRVVYLENTGNSDMKNISISASNNLKNFVSFSPETIELLEKNESSKIIIYFNSTSRSENISGQIVANAEPFFYTYVDADLQVIPGFIPLVNSTFDLTYTCSEINGVVCNYSISSCDGNTTPTNDQLSCCLGKCTTAEKSGSSSIIGWSLIVVAILVAAWFFFKKYRKVE